MAHWNEGDHPRDDHGRFGHGHGLPHHEHGAGGHGDQRGMPSVLSTNQAKLANGDTLTMDRHTDGGMTITTGNGQVTYTKAQTDRLMKDLANADDLDVGDTEPIRTVDVLPDRSAARTTLLGRLDRTGKNTYDLRLRDDDPSWDDLADTPPTQLNGRDLDRIHAAHERSEAATRIDTGNGDADLFIGDDNTFGIRHLGDDGRPVETRFDPASFAKLNRAVDVVIDQLDEFEEFTKGDAAEGVTAVTFPTNVGQVRVQLFGDWNGNNPPADRLEITATDDSWGLVIDGPSQEAWADATTNAEQVAESLGFYDRQMGT
ncbi:hypothetical protein [Microbispora sp. ATCC PTA-5024]|uniref:hypothetical protein n=1 Tax=Microbispora sp. ATCC PTA-5024 TaxID=316330 RepID=UPI0003DDE752|nr:hypothetical protein [Microbispora sp. ATCC PTA-5024]ETK36139.1 hypothetical protein MPTA5024_10970 [Microbispora sp. ATCC PTA-5024]